MTEPVAIPNDDPQRDLLVADAEHPRFGHFCLAGGTYTILIKGSDTAGRYSLIDMYVRKGAGPPPHRHDFEEMFTVLEGEIVMTFRDRKETVRAGQTCNVPANAPHHFTNISETPARMLCMCSPAGQEELFEELGVPVSSRTAPAPELSEEQQRGIAAKAKALAAKYRTEFLPA